MLLSRKKSIQFYENTFEELDLNIQIPYMMVYKKVIFEKLKDDNSIALVISNLLENIDNVINYINNSPDKIKKIYFFVDEVVRTYDKKSNVVSMQLYQVETNLENLLFLEFENIKKILKNVSIEDYEVYSCEKIPKNVQDYINLDREIKYFDLFLCNCAISLSYDRDIRFNKDFDYKISCTNNRFEYHRCFISSLLYGNPDVFLTLCQNIEKNYAINNNVLKLENFNESLRTELEFKLNEMNGNVIYFENNNRIEKNKTPEIKLSSKEQHSKGILKKIENSFLNLVTETRFNSSFNYISEKSIKPINVYRPFVVLSTPGHLNLLKSLGFKTFDAWWDESYDEEKNHHKRFAMVYDIVNDILKKDISELQIMLLEMIPVLYHNKHILNSHLYNNILKFL